MESIYLGRVTVESRTEVTKFQSDYEKMFAIATGSNLV